MVEVSGGMPILGRGHVAPYVVNYFGVGQSAIASESGTGKRLGNLGLLYTEAPTHPPTYY